ncbi:hypothetical protein WIS52_03395 [Pseudonocardia nematodicida]|uniref:Uncharacterized protein n=1 Tax=Pseudonocardia nematodicida TaxID=1206997 RepID=A0ABV1K4X7_9PSEU
MSDNSSGPALRGVCRAMVVGVVGSLVVASLFGIAALLGSAFDELQFRIVLTTLVVAAFGTTSLCHLAVVDRAVRLLGFAGLVAGIVAAVAALVLVWSEWSSALGDVWLKTFFVSTIAAVGLAHANLLLLLAARRQRVVRAGLVITLLAIAVVAVMLVVPVLTDGDVPGGDGPWWQWLGVAAIVDALGTIALPVMALLLRPGRRSSGPAGVVVTGAGDRGGRAEDAAGSAGTVRVVLDLPAELVERIDQRVVAHGSRELVVRDVLERELGSAPRG